MDKPRHLAGFVHSISKYIALDKFIALEENVSTEDIKSVLIHNSLPLSVAEKYLKLYVADIDWSNHIGNLYSNFYNKSKDPELAKENVRKAISCATLLPLIKKTTIPDPPSNLLFWCTAWQEFKEQDWFKLFQEIIKEDVIISENRNKIINIGIIDPIDVSPITRQAYNWLYEKCAVEYQYDSIPEDLKNKLSNLVKAYGGAVICNIFVKHKLYVDKVLNWRSGYFFEKQIYKVYSFDQIAKIKTAEINKTNQKYIKKVGA